MAETTKSNNLLSLVSMLGLILAPMGGIVIYSLTSQREPGLYFFLTAIAISLISGLLSIKDAASKVVVFVILSLGSLSLFFLSMREAPPPMGPVNEEQSASPSPSP